MCITKTQCWRREITMATMGKRYCSSFKIKLASNCFVNISIPSSLELITHFILDWPRIKTCLLSVNTNFGPSCAIEIQILDGSAKHGSFKLQVGVPLLETNHTQKYLVAKNRYLIAIHKSNTNNRKYNICGLITTSAYQSFGVQG